MASTINAKNTSTGVVITPDASGQLELQTADTTRMTIDVNGNVGIGTSSPSSKLTISGGGLNTTNGTVNNVFSQSTDIAVIGTASNHPVTFFSNAAERMRIKTNGDVYLATSNVLEFVNNYHALRSNPNQYVQDAVRASGYIQWSTDIGAIGTNYFMSDISKKENITPSIYNSTALLEKIEFVEFDWKPNTGEEGHVQVGVIAQQLQALDERLVAELSDGTLMIKEPALVTHLAKALQEQITLTKSLQARIETLEGASA